MRLRRLVITAAGVVGLVGGVVTDASAFTWTFYKTTSSPLFTAPSLHGGTVATIQGYGMTTCDTPATWTKYTAVYNGPGVVDNHKFQATNCPGLLSYAHSHPSSYAVCDSMTAGTHYANCPQGIV